MSDPRFRVTIQDREKGRVQAYDVERVLMALALPQPAGEAWMASFRGVNAQQIGAAIAMLCDRAYEIAGSDAIDAVMEQIGRVPKEMRVIDYTEQDSGESGPRE